MKTPVYRPLVIVLAALALAGLPFANAHASSKGGPKDPLARVIEMNKKAVADIQAGRFDAARDTLLDAIVVAKDAGLAGHNMVARTHVHLAANYLTGFKDRAKAIRQLVLALKINPSITMTQQLDTPALQDAYRAALAEVSGKPAPAGAAAVSEPTVPTETAVTKPVTAGGGGRRGLRAGTAAAIPEGEPDPPARVPEALFCPLPDEIPPGEDFVIRCLTKKQTRKSSATIYYREPGAEKFTSLAMSRSARGWLKGTVPGSAISGTAFQFYVEAKLPGVAEPVANGNPESPNLMPVVEGADPMDEGGLARLLRKRAGGSAEGAKPEEEDILARFKEQKALDEEQRLYNVREQGSWFFSLGGGSGSGFHTKEKFDSGSLEIDDRGAYLKPLRVETGSLLATLFQLTPEIGYQLSRKLAVSLQARYQHTPYDSLGWTPNTDRKEKLPPTSALAFFARAQYAFLTLGNLQTYASAVAGGGERVFLLFVPRTCTRAQMDAGECYGAKLPHSDTVSAGVIGLGPGVGVTYHLSRNIALYVEGRAIASLPKVMLLGEFNAGLTVAYRFEKSAPPPQYTEGGWEKPPEASESSE